MTDFNRFARGEDITVGDDPFRKDMNAFMARTYAPQDGIFDIRSRDPKPGLRVFGAFSEPDTFVALTWGYRRDLGDSTDGRFRQAVLSAIGAWDRRFPNCHPFYSENLDDHITFNLLTV